jgi:hypothetical protein
VLLSFFRFLTISAEQLGQERERQRQHDRHHQRQGRRRNV